MEDEVKKPGRPRTVSVDGVSAQNEANKRWAENNKEHKKYLSYRTYVRSFIRKLATQEDLDELKALIAERESGMEK